MTGVNKKFFEKEESLRMEAKDRKRNL